MSDIFISYAREDREHARRLAQALEAQGWSVWWDRTIPAGKSFSEVIDEALSAARCIVVLWSKTAVTSDWVLEEAEEGRQRGILVPVFVERVSPPRGFRRIQAEDLSAWDGSQTSPTFLKLVDDISIILGPPPIREKKEDEEPPSPPKVTPAPKLTRIPHWVYLPISGLVILGIILFTRPWEGKPPDPEFTNSIGMKFVLIQPGTFMMGSGTSAQEVAEKYGGDVEWYQGEHPQHEVKISKPFYMQTTEVTQGQWERVMGNNPSHFKDCGGDCPVESVSWNDVQKFLKKLSQMEGIDKYRLPSEAEWEYACRAGSTTAFSFGDVVSKLGEYAWYHHNSENRTHPVGQKKPNAWGLYDMHGNVWEWCQDWYGSYSTEDVVDPAGLSTGTSRVLRGGSFYPSGRGVRCADRGGNDPNYRDGDLGFRVVLSPS